MHVSEFANCCGIRIIYELPGDVDNPGHKITDLQKEAILQYLNPRLVTGAQYGMTVVAVNNLQVSAGVGEVLEEAGMTKTLGPCYHPDHGNYIYLYSYIHNPYNNEREILRLSREVKKEAIPTPSILMYAVKKVG